MTGGYACASQGKKYQKSSVYFIQKLKFKESNWIIFILLLII